MHDLDAVRTYSQALFAEAKSKNQLTGCAQGLSVMNRALRSVPAFHDVLMHPAISWDRKQKLLHAVLDEFHSPLLEKFLALLIERHRLTLLPFIEVAFGRAVDRSLGVEAFRVRSAFVLSKERIAQLQERLERFLHSKVRLETQVDPSVIGGFVVENQEYMFDQSLKGQLDKLQRQMAG